VKRRRLFGRKTDGACRPFRGDAGRLFDIERPRKVIEKRTNSAGQLRQRLFHK
jgi:hypothetical protein